MRLCTRIQWIVLAALAIVVCLCTPSGALHGWRDVRDMAAHDGSGVFKDPMKFLASVKTVTVTMVDLPYYSVPVKQRDAKVSKFVHGKPKGIPYYLDVLEKKAQSLGFKTVKHWESSGDGRLYFVVNYTKPVPKEDVYIYSARLHFGLPRAEPTSIAYENERLGIATEADLGAKVLADWYALAEIFTKDCHDTK